MICAHRFGQRLGNDIRGFLLTDIKHSYMKSDENIPNRWRYAKLCIYSYKRLPSMPLIYSCKEECSPLDLSHGWRYAKC